MEKVLFINACMRGKEISRTFKLAEAFLREYQACNDCIVEKLI